MVGQDGLDGTGVVALDISTPSAGIEELGKGVVGGCEDGDVTGRAKLGEQVWEQTDVCGEVGELGVRSQGCGEVHGLGGSSSCQSGEGEECVLHDCGD